MEKGVKETGFHFLTGAEPGSESFDPNALSPLTLAFVGDAVWALMAATFLVNRGNTRGEKLHRRSTEYVSAKAQARIVKHMQESGCLEEKEEEILRRGINAKPHSQAKNASSYEYHLATALEALVGYLYLADKKERAEELFLTGVGVIEG